MTIAARLLVAADEDDVIGRDGDLPWRLPGDLRRFAMLTRGHAVVMGRLTYESILRRLGHPLPGRRSIIVSARGLGGSALPDGVDVVPSPQGALALARVVTTSLGQPDWFLIGGASLYAELLPHMDVVDLTRVHARVGGDARMPAGWLNAFREVARQEAQDPAADHRYTFVRLERFSAAAEASA